MKRRHFLALSSGATATMALCPRVFAKDSRRIDAAWYQQFRRFVDLQVCKVAYVERGRGPAAVFMHGFPLNGFQWRGALERLHAHRRCIAPDVMGLGFTQTPEGQPISSATQVEMLGMFLDALHIDTVDLVGNDSGGLLSQLFVAKFPERVRTLLLTNCDVDENNPPPMFLPIVELAKRGVWVDERLVPLLEDKQLARSAKGLGFVYSNPENLADETIETYLRPLTVSPLRKAQVQQYLISLGTNELLAIRGNLRRWKGPARLVWGLKDVAFGVQWAEWLDRTLPGSLGVRRVEGANLFFPEEMPELIAEEAAKLWGADGRRRTLDDPT
jgi:pimeloyl-ACP methyl ester carboxylesterase